MTIPSTSPIAQPVRQWTVALNARRFRPAGAGAETCAAWSTPPTVADTPIGYLAGLDDPRASGVEDQPHLPAALEAQALGVLGRALGHQVADLHAHPVALGRQ